MSDDDVVEVDPTGHLYPNNIVYFPFAVILKRNPVRYDHLCLPMGFEWTDHVLIPIGNAWVSCSPCPGHPRSVLLRVAYPNDVVVIQECTASWIVTHNGGDEMFATAEREAAKEGTKA